VVQKGDRFLIMTDDAMDPMVFRPVDESLR
jgi:hypothetical protein